MRDSLNLFEQTLLLWQNFEEKHCGIEEWLQEKEKECDNLLRVGNDQCSVSETDSEADGSVADRTRQLQACKVGLRFLFFVFC